MLSSGSGVFYPRHGNHVNHSKSWQKNGTKRRNTAHSKRFARSQALGICSKAACNSGYCGAERRSRNQVPGAANPESETNSNTKEDRKIGDKKLEQSAGIRRTPNASRVQMGWSDGQRAPRSSSTVGALALPNRSTAVTATASACGESNTKPVSFFGRS